MRKQYNMMMKILASTLCGIIGGSMLVPFLTLSLKHAGHSESAIGFFNSLSWISLLIASPYVAKITAKFGYRRTYIFTGVVSILYVLALFFAQNFYVWCVVHFLIGAIWATRWVTTEAFINAIAPEDKRGKFIGIYGSLIWIALAIGPSILLVTGTSSNLPFYVAMGLFFISFLLNFLVEDVKEVYDPHDETSLKSVSFFKTHKFFFFAAFLGGVFENGITPISVLYGISVGIDKATAPLVASCIGFGALLVQYPIGWVADKYKGRNHYLTLSVILLLANLLLLLAPQMNLVIFITAFFWGIFGPAMYVLLITKLGGMYKKNDLVAVTAFIIFGYTSGGIMAPLVGGATIELTGVYGLPILLCAISAVIAISAKVSGAKYKID